MHHLIDTLDAAIFLLPITVASVMVLICAYRFIRHPDRPLGTSALD